MTVSNASASESAPVPLAIARSMLSLGIDWSLAFWIALARAALPSGSPPPSLAATWIARASLVNRAPRLASFAPFWCLIELHLEWPDMASNLEDGDALDEPVRLRPEAQPRVERVRPASVVRRGHLDAVAVPAARLLLHPPGQCP